MKSSSRIDDAIRRLLSQGASIASIKCALGVGQERIERARNSPMGTRVCKKAGRPPKVSPNISFIIEAETLSNGALHDQELADLILERHGVVISHDTVRRVRQSHGFRFRPRMVVQDLTESQKSQRLEFCQWMLNRDDIDFSKIVFSDESRFCKGPDNSWVYVRRGQWNESVMSKKTKYSSGIMCFGAIGLGFKSDLVVCRRSVDSQEYTKNLEESRVIQAMDSEHGAFRWLLMQDGAPCHTCQATMQWLRDKVNILPGWPPNSPDLNPIETLWAIIKQRLNKFTGTIEERVVEVWGAIPQKTIDNLVMTFRHRCEMVVATAGESISQHLSSHIEPSPVHPPQERQCDASLDEELLQSFRDYGNRWAMIADQINSKHGTQLTSQYIRQRVKVLNERELMDQQFRRVTDIHEPSLSTDSPFNLRPI